MVTNSFGNVKKSLLTATVVIGASALLFMGLFQAVSASEREKGVGFENSNLPETGNITPELPNLVGAVPSNQTEEEAQIEQEVELPTAQPEGEATLEQEVTSAQPEGEFPEFSMPDWLYEDIKKNAPHVFESNEETFNYIKEHMPYIFEDGIIQIKGYTDELLIKK